MLVDIIKQTIMITSFVLGMMLLIEYISVQTRGKWSKPIQRSTWYQIVLSALLGITPGCLGAYTVVTLYSHRIVNFAALITAMIATFGDEAFIMFSMIPAAAVKLTFIIFFIAVFSGFVVNLFSKNRSLMKLEENHLNLHLEEPDCRCFEPDRILPQIRQISFHRAILLTGTLLFVFLVITGKLVHSHDFGMIHESIHENHGLHSDWDWVRVTFLGVSLFAAFIFITVPDHFLENHFWEHIIKKHFLKIFLWTFGALLLIGFGLEYLNLQDWLQGNQLVILFIAILVGIIPESGPHIIFITLFADGAIPFSILLANSIVQDGHAALPLLAESRKSFVAMKAVNLVAGLIVGLLGFFFAF